MTEEAKKFVNAEMCINILALVGFRVVDSATTPADIKLQVKMVDNHSDDGWLTMNEFKLCYGILDQNQKSIIEARKVNNLTFRRCVTCFFGIFCNSIAFFSVSFV